MKFFLLTFLFILVSCNNPLGKLEQTSDDFCAGSTGDTDEYCNPDVTVSLVNWDFLSSANYSFDTNYVDVSAGKASLKTVNTLFSSFTGTHSGTKTILGKLSLDTSVTSSLDTSWTPQYASLVSYWKMDGNWSDSIGLNHGIASGTAGFSTVAKVGTNSGSFNGANSDYVTVPDSASLDFGANDFTISFWTNRRENCTGYDNTWGIGKWNTGGTPGVNEWVFGFCLTGGAANDISFTLESGVIKHKIAASYTYKLDEWVSVIATRRGAILELYINGNLAGSLNVGAAVANNVGRDLRFACSELNSLCSNALYDEISLWSVGLTKAEVQTVYGAQKNKFYGEYESSIIDMGTSVSWPNINPVSPLPFLKALTQTAEDSTASHYSDSLGSLHNGLVGLWHFDETAPTAGAANDFIDSSVNSNHGEAINSPGFGAQGKLDKAITSRDLTTDTVEIPNHASLSSAGPQTFCFWFKADSLNINWAGFVSKWLASTSQRSFLMGEKNGTDKLYFYASSDGVGNVNIPSDNDIVIGRWTHACGLFDGAAISMYVDGELQASSAAIGSIFVGTAPLEVGSFNARTHSFDGSIDELGLWSRALSSSEIQNLYRRGANRIKYQVRTCSDATCSSDPDWKGDFSELSNCSTLDVSGNCSGTINGTSPDFTFADYPLGMRPANSRYFQYKVIMEADANTACAGSSVCLPELTSVEVGPAGSYYGGSPVIKNTTPIVFDDITDIDFTEGGTCNLTYQLSSDNTNFYYYTGGAWTLAAGENLAQSSNGAVLKTNISSFKATAGSGSLYWKAFMTSDTSQSCELDKINVAVNN